MQRSSNSNPLCYGQGDFLPHPVAQSPIQADLEDLQRCGFCNFSQKPVPVSHDPHRQKFLPNALSQSILLQLKVISSCPIATCLCGKSIFCLLVRLFHWKIMLEQLSISSWFCLIWYICYSCSYRWCLSSFLCFNYCQKQKASEMLWNMEFHVFIA